MTRIGLLGAAKITPSSIIRPAQQRSDVEVVAVAARDRARAEAFATRHGVPAVAESYADLVSRPDVDLVYVALPAAAHCEWTIRALQAGKAVLCEKPFALNAGEARQMVEAARTAGRPLLEAIHYRFHPIIERARACVGSGELGKILSAEGVFTYPVEATATEIRWSPEQGGGALLDDGCYPIHALRTILGVEPIVVSARSRRARGVDAETWAELTFGQTRTWAHVSLEARSPVARLFFQGERGNMIIRNFIMPQAGSRFTVVADGVVREESTSGPATYVAQLGHVINVLEGRERPLTGGDDAIANLTAIDAIRRAAQDAG